jgi:protein phosphatase
MGSTVVGFVAGARHGWIFNFGDSRAYVPTAERLHRVSQDHTPGRSVTGARGHALTQSLGGTLTPRPLSPHVVHLDLASTEAVLPCSGGLTNMVDDEEIEAPMERGRDDPAKALIDAALDAGGVDNVTVAVVRLRD